MDPPDWSTIYSLERVRCLAPQIGGCNFLSFKAVLQQQTVAVVSNWLEFRSLVLFWLGG